MNEPAYTVGQAVYVRTDTPDFAEEAVPFCSLAELVKVASEPRENCVLEKLIVYAMVGEQPTAVTLSFVAATLGLRPAIRETEVEP